MKNIHIGKLIRAKTEERGISVAELAAAISCSRTNVYKIYHRKSIDVELLLRISKVLEHNFIEEVYLNRSSHTKSVPMNNYTIEITSEIVRITNHADANATLIFQRKREK